MSEYCHHCGTTISEDIATLCPLCASKPDSLRREEIDEFAAKLKTMKKPTTTEEAATARIECDDLFCALKRIEELENDKKFLIETGEKLVRWVESPRHSEEEVRDHNGRLKDTKVWAAFYVAVRGIQRKDKTLTRADIPQNSQDRTCEA